jgi:hypothetical protein
MDPFSLAAGSIGITGVAAAGFGQLHRRISSFRDAPMDIQTIQSSLEELQQPLRVLTELCSSPQQTSMAIMRDIEQIGLANVVNNCGAKCENFARKIERWTRRSDSDTLVFWDRFLVGVWHKEEFRTFFTQLQTCVNTVQLALGTTQL